MRVRYDYRAGDRVISLWLARSSDAAGVEWIHERDDAARFDAATAQSHAEKWGAAVEAVT